MLVVIALMFVLAVQETKRKDYLLLYILGNAVAAGFVTLAITFYLMQFS
jgi:hypothetical protein